MCFSAVERIEKEGEEKKTEYCNFSNISERFYFSRYSYQYIILTRNAVFSCLVRQSFSYFENCFVPFSPRPPRLLTIYSTFREQKRMDSKDDGSVFVLHLANVFLLFILYYYVIRLFGRAENSTSLFLDNDLRIGMKIS